MLKILSLRIKDNPTFNLLKEIIGSYSSAIGKKIGMPIGNLTSQIFANIYLNELDRFVKHTLKPKAYLRYGDDFIIIENNLEKLEHFRQLVIWFLTYQLKLKVNPKSDKIIKSRQGLKYLGVKLWPTGRILSSRNLLRVRNRLNQVNLSSYRGLVWKHGNEKLRKEFDWKVKELLDPETSSG